MFLALIYVQYSVYIVYVYMCVRIFAARYGLLQNAECSFFQAKG